MGLRENMREETVSRLALRDPVTASPEASLSDAVKLMRSRKLGCVIVIGDRREPVGIFTERMLTQLIAKDPSVLNQPLKQHMAELCPWVRMTDTIENVMDAMLEKNIRFLAVINEEGGLTGLTGQKGLMEYVADHFPSQVMVQRLGGTPYTSNREGA